jgi:hypothetical protein
MPYYRQPSPPPPSDEVITWPLVVLVLIYLLFGSCRSRTDLAQLCAESFPPKMDTTVVERLRTDTLTLAGQTVTVVDTTYCPPGLSETRLVVDTIVRRLPARIHTYEVITHDTVIEYRDAALNVELATKNRELIGQVERLRGTSSTMKWLIGFIVGIAVLVLAIRLLF